MNIRDQSNRSVLVKTAGYPVSDFLKPGDVVWSKEHPFQKLKVLGTEFDAIHGSILWVHLEDLETGEHIMADASHITKQEIAKGQAPFWRDIYEVKPGETQLSAEIELFKKASATPEEDKDLYLAVVLPHLQNSGVSTEKTEEFMRTASVKTNGRSVFFTDKDEMKILVATIEDNQPTGFKFICSGKEIIIRTFESLHGLMDIFSTFMESNSISMIWISNSFVLTGI